MIVDIDSNTRMFMDSKEIQMKYSNGEELDIAIDEFSYDPQFAENENVIDEENNNEYARKRELLEKTKLVKQTWSILEIIEKIKSGKLILNPDYQRSDVWKNDRKTAFIESLYMGILIPPIYVVEVTASDLLEVNKYEVVDGKQRLTAIKEFVENRLQLNRKSLEYYGDIFDGKYFADLKESYREKTGEMLSSILDVYVVTAKSPEFTKYDIFARLNKGAEPLKVNEIRRAIYRSAVTDLVREFVENRINGEIDKTEEKRYRSVFSKNAIKHFDDYGRFYRSIAFFLRTSRKDKVVKNYNSRPRDMINDVLQKLQEGELTLTNEKVDMILNRTLDMMVMFKDNQFRDYLVDACIPYIFDKWDLIETNIDLINNDEEINSSFEKSTATTSNVNKRLRRISAILGE